MSATMTCECCERFRLRLPLGKEICIMVLFLMAGEKAGYRVRS